MSSLGLPVNPEALIDCPGKRVIIPKAVGIILRSGSKFLLYFSLGKIHMLW
jgi:hypothetical protein